MSEASIIYWRDIPTQVTMGSGRRALKRMLADRFMVAVDKAAMASGASDTASYLQEWRKEKVTLEDEGEMALEQLVTRLENEFSAKRLAELARQGGWLEPRGT